MKNDFSTFGFTGTDGNFHIIQAVPITRLENLCHLLNQFKIEIANCDPDKYRSFTSCYLFNPQIKSLTNSILKLGGIQPEWLSIEMVLDFIHHTVDDEGNISSPLLAQINNLEPAPKHAAEDNFTVTKNSSLSQDILLGLINYKLVNNLLEAYQVLDSTPHDQLYDLIKRQAEIKYPKKGKAHSQEEYKDAEKAFNQLIKDGEFFKGFNPTNSN